MCKLRGEPTDYTNKYPGIIQRLYNLRCNFEGCSVLPKALRMKKGNSPALSTPAEDRSTNLAIVSGEFLMSVVVALKSVSSGLPPAHLHGSTQDWDGRS